MRSKSFNRGGHETTHVRADIDWAQQALDMVDRRDAYASDPERRLLLANVYASLAVYEELRALRLGDDEVEDVPRPTKRYPQP